MRLAKVITAAVPATTSSMASSQILGFDGLSFTITSYHTHQISQQAGNGGFTLSMNDTLAGEIRVPGFHAACTWTFMPGNSDPTTGERLPEIVECEIDSPNPHNSIVATTRGGSEVSYYFYSPEKSSSFVVGGTTSPNLYTACPSPPTSPENSTCKLDFPATNSSSVRTCRDVQAPCPPSPTSQPLWPPDPTTLSDYRWVIGNWTWTPAQGITPYSFVTTGHFLKAGRDLDVVQTFQIKCTGTPYAAGTTPTAFQLCQSSTPFNGNPLATWVVMPPDGSSTVQVGVLLRGRYFSTNSKSNSVYNGGNKTWDFITMSKLTPSLNILDSTTVHPSLEPQTTWQIQNR